MHPRTQADEVASVPDLLNEPWARIVAAVVVGLLSIVLVRLLSGWLVRLVVRPSRWLELEGFALPGEDTRFVRRLTTLRRFAARAYTTVAIAAVVLFIMYTLDLRLYGVLAGAGIVGIAVAFGAQAVIRDVLSGIFILVENPYDIGDYIRLNLVDGEVTAISLRHTTLVGDDGTIHTVPNGAITLTSNFTRDATNHTMTVRVGAATSYDDVVEAVDRVAQRLAVAPELEGRLADGPRVGGIASFRSDSYEIEIRSRVHRSLRRTWPLMLNRQLQESFAEAGIEVL